MLRQICDRVSGFSDTPLFVERKAYYNLINAAIRGRLLGSKIFEIIEG